LESLLKRGWVSLSRILNICRKKSADMIRKFDVVSVQSADRMA
jgi:hypothetical protein